MIGSFDKISLIARQVQRDRLKTQTQATESRFNHGLGLRQFTTPEPVSLAKTCADPTANTSVGNLTNPR